MRRSCQRLEDDPRNQDGWKIYPEPPPPSWPLPSQEEITRRKEKEKRREADPVAAVGSDFSFDQCEIPGNHEVSTVLFVCSFCFNNLRLNRSPYD